MSNIGRVVPRPGRPNRFAIDFGRHARPRYLLSANGVRFECREVADATLAQIRRLISRGLEPQAAVDRFAPKTSARVAIRGLLDLYVAHVKQQSSAGQLSPTHAREVERCASEKGAFAYWDGQSTLDVTAAALEQWAANLQTNGLSPKTVKNILGYFSAFLSWLHRTDRLESVPPMPRVRVPTHVPTILSPEQQTSVLAEIPWEIRGAFLACAIGIRPGEVRALDLGDVSVRDAAMGILVARAVKGTNANDPIRETKTGEAAWVPCDERLAEWLTWRLQQWEPPFDAPTMFPKPNARNADGRWPGNGLRLEWHDACRRAGVPKTKLYEGTKHSSATAWRAQGVPLDVIQALLRHRNARSTERYAKLADKQLADVVRGARRKEE